MEASIKINGVEYQLRLKAERVNDCFSVCPLGKECDALNYDQIEFCLPLFMWGEHGRRFINRFVLEEVTRGVDEGTCETFKSE